jgi:hypothetical protein
MKHDPNFARLLPIARAQDLSAVSRQAAPRRRDYVIVYLRRGVHLSSSPWSGKLEAAKRIARNGLISHSADECQLRADTLDGTLIWSEHRDATGPFGR